MSARIFENTHPGFEEFDGIRVFNPEKYMFENDVFMHHRIYNFVMIVSRSIALSKFGALRVYLRDRVRMNSKEINKSIGIVRAHTSHFVKVSEYESCNGVTSYVKFLLSSVYPLFYCSDTRGGSMKLTNYIFGDQLPGGAENMVEILDLDDCFTRVMSSDGCLKGYDGILDINHFRCTFKNYEVQVEAGKEDWVLFRF